MRLTGYSGYSILPCRAYLMQSSQTSRNSKRSTSFTSARPRVHPIPIRPPDPKPLSKREVLQIAEESVRLSALRADLEEQFQRAKRLHAEMQMRMQELNENLKTLAELQEENVRQKQRLLFRIANGAGVSGV